MKRAVRRSGGGFTLLEVLAAVAILAASLVVIINIVTRNVRATNHARLVTTATFLARAKIIDVEDGVLTNGFLDENSEEQGTFEEEGFPQFRWTTIVEKLELPTNLAQEAQDKAAGDSTSTNPMTAMAGFMGGFMTTLIEPIRVGLEESIRKLTVRVSWDEIGTTKPQLIEVSAFMTDPAKLDLAMGAAGALPGATGGAGAGGATPAPAESKKP